MSHKKWREIITAMAFFLLAEADAGVAISETRIILTEEKPSSSFFLSNTYSYPVLMQVWAGDGDPNSTPDTDTSPVIVVPPVFRLSPDESTGIRLIHDGSDFPGGKEGLYWLNIYEVPALPENLVNAESVRMQVATRTQIKIFLREKGLSSTLEEVVKALRCRISVVNDVRGIVCMNNSPFHVTLADIRLKGMEGGVMPGQDMMIPPGENRVYRHEGLQGDYSECCIEAFLIGDNGKVKKFTLKIDG